MWGTPSPMSSDENSDRTGSDSLEYIEAHQSQSPPQLSSSSFARVVDTVRAGSMDVNEAALSEALSELQEVNEAYAKLCTTVSHIQRSANAHSERLSELEVQVASVKTHCEDLVSSAKTSYCAAERSLMKERKTLEEIQAMCVGDVADLKTKLQKLDVDFNALKARLANTSSSLRSDALSEIERRIESVELDRASVLQLVQNLQEQVNLVVQEFRLPHSTDLNDSYSFPSQLPSTEGSISPPRSLADELSRSGDFEERNVTTCSSHRMASACPSPTGSTSQARNRQDATSPVSDKRLPPTSDIVLLVYIVVLAAFLATTIRESQIFPAADRSYPHVDHLKSVFVSLRRCQERFRSTSARYAQSCFRRLDIIPTAWSYPTLTSPSIARRTAVGLSLGLIAIGFLGWFAYTGWFANTRQVDVGPPLLGEHPLWEMAVWSLRDQ
ncbi:hypothetical protein OH77DRAFT_924781 [Trametes cingulata]|nr:hypothetical protein OH77DRAFT_924781 [Trametes cingulata]